VVLLKKGFYLFLLLLVLFPLFSTEVLAINYDTDRYYWDCEEPALGGDISVIERCLKKRLIPLNYYPYIGFSGIIIIGYWYYSRKKANK
jgi:hypothetical protein